MSKQERNQRWYHKRGKDYQRAYRARNPEATKAYDRQRYLQAGLTRKLRDYLIRAPANDPALTKENLIQKFGSNPVCYLTGVPIDLKDTSTYTLDHIIPVSRGGKSTLENCGLTSRRANQAKSDMLLDEFRTFCQLVVSRLPADI